MVNSLSKKKAYHHGDLRAALVQATLLLVADRGPRGFSMSEACRRAGVSATAVYRHFANKEAILAEVARLGFEQLHQDIDETLATLESATPFQRLAAAGEAYVRFAQQHPAHFQVMFSSGLDKSCFPDTEQSGHSALAVLLAEVERAVQQGAMAPEHSSSAVCTLWATVHGLAMLNLDGLRPTGEHAIVFDVPRCIEASLRGFCQ